jgi:hypothetical protein
VIKDPYWGEIRLVGSFERTPLLPYGTYAHGVATLVLPLFLVGFSTRLFTPFVSHIFPWTRLRLVGRDASHATALTVCACRSLTAGLFWPRGFLVFFYL